MKSIQDPRPINQPRRTYLQLLDALAYGTQERIEETAALFADTLATWNGTALLEHAHADDMHLHYQAAGVMRGYAIEILRRRNPKQKQRYFISARVNLDTNHGVRRHSRYSPCEGEGRVRPTPLTDALILEATRLLRGETERTDSG